MTGLRFSIRPWDAVEPVRQTGPTFDEVIADARRMADEFPSERLFEVSLGDKALAVRRKDLLNDLDEVARQFRVRANRMFLYGCCWHFALVGHRLTALDVVQVVPEDGVPTHVALVLPDGAFFDSRGIIETERDLHLVRDDEVPKVLPFPIESLEQVVKPDRDDPDLQLFLEETEAWFRLLASMVGDRLTLKEEPRHGLA